MSAHHAAARQWLAAHGADVPPALRTRMEAAVADVDPDRAASVPLTLGEAALACLRDARALCDERGAALHLLAADALITAAYEAAAGSDAAADEMRALWAAFSPEQLAVVAARP